MFEHMLLVNTAGGKSPNAVTGPVVIASDGGVDWYGEVPASEFITGDALASLIGLTAGTAQHSTAGWLHVGLDGTELLIAKRPLRNNVSWNDINNVNAVFGGLIVSVGENHYKVRLLKGANSDPTSTVTGYDVTHSHGSEWNRMFYRLTQNVYLETNNTKASEEPFVNLANYSESDLILDSFFGPGQGSRVWTQETAGTDRVCRGGSGVSVFARTQPAGTNSTHGWRPVLEKTDNPLMSGGFN